MGRNPGQWAGDAQGTEVQQTGWLMAKGRGGLNADFQCM